MREKPLAARSPLQYEPATLAVQQHRHSIRFAGSIHQNVAIPKGEQPTLLAIALQMWDRT